MGVYGYIENNELYLEAAILSLDGKLVIRGTLCSGPAGADDMGRRLAQRMYVQGGREILAELVSSEQGEKK